MCVSVCVPYLLMLRTWLTLTDEKEDKNSRKKTTKQKNQFVSLSVSGL